MRTMWAILFGAFVCISGCSGSLYVTRSPEATPAWNDVYLLPYYTSVNQRLTVSIQKAKIEATVPKTPTTTSAASSSHKPDDACPDPKLPDDSSQMLTSNATERQFDSNDHFTGTKRTCTTTTTFTKPPAPSLPQIVIGTIATPQDRGILYFRKSWTGLFNSSAAFSTTVAGLPTKSDASSTQQLTAILSEIGQTLGQIVAGGLKAFGIGADNQIFGLDETAQAKILTSTRDKCIGMLNDTSPFYTEMPLHKTPATPPGGSPPVDDVRFDGYQLPTAGINPRLIVWVEVQNDIPRPPSQNVSAPRGSDGRKSKTGSKGFYAYYPSQTHAYITCQYTDGSQVGVWALAQPITVSLYRNRLRLDPQRGFWTSPQDSYVLTDGILVEHKYSEQSPVKTLVDLLTSPLRAIMPSTQTTNTTSTQVSGQGRTTTNSTSTQVGPPKGP